MYKRTKYLSVLLAFAFFLSACGNGAATATPVLSPTASITPIPTIPTFAPTFDVRTIVTVTPAEAALCPETNASLQIILPPDFVNLAPEIMEKWSHFDSSLLDYLNKGGTVENLDKSYQGNEHLIDYTGGFRPTAIDLTNDDVPEVIVVNPFSDLEKPTPAVYVFSCDQGHYDLLYTWKMPGTIAGIQKVTIRDLNIDGIPELIVQTGSSDFGNIGTLWIYEWDGQTFQSLLLVPYSPAMELVYRRGALNAQNLEYKDRILVFGNYDFDFQDIDNNGTIELITIWNDVRYSDGPSRNVKIIFSWNGQNFALHRTIYSEPEYRFQAIQDGDNVSEFGEYEKAISLYQDAISSDKLLTYRWDDSSHLAAYAYFRIVALHVYLGEVDAATDNYNTLQTTFPEGNAGHPYAEMATAFWDAYQSSGNMTAACGAAIQYAAEHPEILVPLGSDYHGWQSHIYVPADVCPFR
jgi:hypothetical protein